MTDTATPAPRKVPQDRLLSRKKPRIARVRIALDLEIAEAYQEAKFDHDIKKDTARRYSESVEAQREYTAAKGLLDQTEKAYEENSIVFVLRSIGPKSWDDLVMEHPATDEIKKRYVDEKRGTESEASNLPWDPFVFSQALLMACCKEPALSDEDVNDMFEGDNWSQAEVGELVSAAMNLNNVNRVVELGKD